MTRSSLLRSTASLLALAALAACGDAPAAPAASFLEVDLSLDPGAATLVNAPADAPVLPGSIAPGGASTVKADIVMMPSSSSRHGDTTVVTFSVSPSRDGIYPIGRHWIFFEEDAICDPARSTYGQGYWNHSCRSSSSAILVTAKVYADAEGRPVVSFDQHLRFNPRKRVILHMTVDIAGVSEPKILWFRDASQLPVDESAQDAAMVTRQGDQLLTYRRIKHFSGYTVSTGRLLPGVEAEVGVRRTFPFLGGSQLNSGHLVATGAVAAPQAER